MDWAENGIVPDYLVPTKWWFNDNPAGGIEIQRPIFLIPNLLSAMRV
jgi:hypothetical protein